MAITILNPARFNGDGGVGGRQFIRAAFFDEGYGVSSSFKAYAQGAGIVPATAAFNAIGAGTVGDPLRMSQFSGFVVPSLFTFSPAGLSSYPGEGLSDGQYPSTSAQITIGTSPATSVVWNWSKIGGAGAASVVNGGSASSITFTLVHNNTSRDSTFLVNALDSSGNLQYWEVYLESLTFD